MSWWRRPRLRCRAEDELDAELRDHVERQVADYVRAGMSAGEARRRARLEFGGLDQVKEMCRDVHRTRWMEDLGRDLHYALRRQLKDRSSGVSWFAIATLAIGIGASTAMFGVLDAVVLQPLPFAQEERLVAGWKTSRTDPTRLIELSYPEFLAWRAQSTSFESLAALPTTVYGYSLIGWDLPYRLPGQSAERAADNSILNLEVVTPTWFEAIGTPLLAGRGFSETDALTAAGAGAARASLPAAGSTNRPQPGAPTESTDERLPSAATGAPAERQPSGTVESASERWPLVAIVSDSVAREMYGSPREAVGQRFIGGRNAPRSYRIVGVVADGRYRRVQEVSGDVFLPYTQTAIPLRYVVVRASAGPATARAILRSALAEVDPEQPMSADLTTTELVDRALSRERFQSGLLLPFGLGSALLAAIGVFGMVSDTANRRLRELALRQALGAHRSRVLAGLLRSTLTCVLAGLAAGLLLAVATDRTLNLTLFETSLADPWIVVAVWSLVLGVSLAACIGPAARVVRIELGTVLRQ